MMLCFTLLGSDVVRRFAFASDVRISLLTLTNFNASWFAFPAPFSVTAR
jgi:hypothetical protein